MLTGFAFLDPFNKVYIETQEAKRNLTKVAFVTCADCGAVYWLFAGPDLPDDKDKAALDIKDLKNRADHFIYKDCPNTVAEGQPKRGSHTDSFELLQSGRISF